MSDQGNPNDGFDSLLGLVSALKYAVSDVSDLTNYLEDYIIGYLDVDLGMGLFVEWWKNEDDSEGIQLWTIEGVSMWILDFPVSRAAFFAYLDELDRRVARLRAILEIPNVDEWEEAVANGDDSLVSTALAGLFRLTEGEVTRRLDRDLVPVESDSGGLYSNPVRFLLWKQEFVVGLDDEYVHIYKVGTSIDHLDVHDVIGSCDWGDGDSMSLTDLGVAPLE